LKTKIKIKEVESCPICTHEFNIFENIPKILKCCKKPYCLKCLIEWQKQNANCPTCRVKYSKSPEHLPSYNKVFQHKCPSCGLFSNKLFVKKFEDEWVFDCETCNENVYNNNTNEKKYEFFDFFEKIINKKIENTKLKPIAEIYHIVYKKLEDSIDKLKNKLLQSVSENLSELIKNTHDSNEISKAINYFNENDPVEYNLKYLNEFINKYSDEKKL